MEASSQNWVWHQSAKKEDSRPRVSGRNRIDRQRCSAVQEGRPGFRSHRPASRGIRRVRLSQGERDTSYQASEHVLRRGSSCPCRRTSCNQFSQKSEHPARTRGLIRGAGGSIGTVAVQLAKSYGGIVTGVDRTGKLDTIRSIGAHHVVDYAKEDFTKNGKTYDVIFDAVGRSSFSGLMRSVKGDGLLLLGNLVCRSWSQGYVGRKRAEKWCVGQDRIRFKI